MLADFEGGLSGFTSNRAVVRLLTGVLGNLKGESALEGCGGLKGFQGGRTATMNVEGVVDAGLAVAEVTGALDGGEIFVGVATPARTALSLFDAHVEWAPGINDLEDEHGLDAITRLVGVGLIAEGLCEGDSDESANQFLNTAQTTPRPPSPLSSRNKTHKVIQLSKMYRKTTYAQLRLDFHL